MKTTSLGALVLLLGTASVWAAAPAKTDWQAQNEHQQGRCGTLGPGTGLVEGKGWVVSMLPGRHQFRMRGGGAVYLTAARQSGVDFDIGRLYYIVIEGAPAGAVLEWKMLGRDWQPVGRTFLYPPVK
ncbi:MAG: hypothetical protein M3Z16_08015 [Pseudomonadota bacterium]|nr:hypothetical protein [Pseudomonadota bacterium]